MRINLVTPFAEKDAAKALGARWDPTRKVWYITDVKDLTPFMRWIPDLDAATAGGARPAPATRARPSSGATTRAATGVLTGPAAALPHCGCRVLPWEDCEHSLAARRT